jgi:DNA polymerase-1
MRAAAAQGWDVTIVSSDKDLMQLVGGVEEGPRIDMLDTMKNIRIFLPEVAEKFGVTPDRVGDVLALMGDSVDNVPGIRGIGPKTATKLIVEHGDLESALAAAPTMKASKLRESLIEQADMARLSRVLVALKEDAPLPLALEDFKLGAIPRTSGGFPERTRLYQPAQAPGRGTRQPGTRHATEPGQGGDDQFRVRGRAQDARRPARHRCGGL